MPQPLKPLIVVTTLLTLINACTGTGNTPGSVTPAGAGPTKAVVSQGDPEFAKSSGNVARYLSQLNLAVINLEHKRPPLMPISKATFAAKQTAPEASPAPQSVSDDDDFLDSGLPTSAPEGVNSERANADGSLNGTIDEDGDGTVDQTYTGTKPVETLQTDGTKKVATTYTVDSKGEKDVFDVQATVDGNGKVTGGEMDWQDDKLGKNHVTFKGQDINFEPIPGMRLVMRSGNLDAKNHSGLNGDIVFDDRFASSKQAPGNGLPETKPMQVQGRGESWRYKTPNYPYDQYVGGEAEAYGAISAAVWCVDNEIGISPLGNDWARIGWEIRRDWCKFKNFDRWWANDWRRNNEKDRLKLYANGEPAVVVKVALRSGNGSHAAANMVVTMPDGSEVRTNLPATGEATLQNLVKR